MHTFTDAIRDLFERQFGVASRRQFRALLTEDQIDGLVQSGVLRPIHRGVYRVDGAPHTPEQLAMAAVLRARAGARIDGPFVLGLLGVDGFTRDDPFEVLVAEGRRLHNVDFPWRPDPVPGLGAASHGALPIVTPARAFVATARLLSDDERRLRVGIHSARWRGTVTPPRLREWVDRLHGLDPGSDTLRALFEQGVLENESEGETELGRHLALFDPAPEPQVWVTPTLRVDWYWRQLRLAPEYDGAVDHAHAAGRRHDRRREEELAALGVQRVPVRAADLARPDELLRWMEAVTLVRARELAVTPPRRLQARAAR